MKRLVLAGIALCAATALAMPTKSELSKAQRLVGELMSSSVEDFKAKKKSATEVAEAAEALAAEASTEAAKFLLFKGALAYYVRSGEYDKAADAVDKLQAAVNNVPPDVLAEIISRVSSRINAKNAPRLFARYRAASALVKAERDIASCTNALKKNPEDTDTRRKLAEAYALVGNWTKALDEFAKVRGETAKIARGEKSGTVTADKAAEFWWSYPYGEEDEITGFKRHAAELYRTALDKNLLQGLNKTLAERRIAETEKIPEPAAAPKPVLAAAAPKPSPSLKADAAKTPTMAESRGAPSDSKVDKPLKKCAFELKPGVKIEFVECPAGSFTMGRDKDPKSAAAKHKVTITRPFWMATTKLTVEQWKAYSKGYEAPKEAMLLGGEQQPVMSGFWNDASVTYKDFDKFCQHLTSKHKNKIPRNYVFRSPTEAEWEYAYSANATEGFYAEKSETHSKFGFRSKDINGIAKEKGIKVLQDWRRSGVAVAQFPPNPWGLYDMAGNTWERTLDTVDQEMCDSGWHFDKNQTALLYAAEETDPLRVAPEGAKKIVSVGRGGDMGNIGKRQHGRSFRLCIGPDPKLLNAYPKK